MFSGSAQNNFCLLSAPESLRSVLSILRVLTISRKLFCKKSWGIAMEYFALKSGRVVDKNELRLLAFQAAQPSDEQYKTFIATFEAMAEMLGCVDAQKEASA